MHAAELSPSVVAIARQLAAGSAPGLARTKQDRYESWERTPDQQPDIERDCQRELGFTADYAEGVAAFLARRLPRFPGD